MLEDLRGCTKLGRSLKVEEDFLFLILYTVR